MNTKMTEKKVLKKLGIEDFTQLTKDKIVSMATMLDKMDPEVAKKAVDQFPDFSKTMKEVFCEYKAHIDEGLKSNEKSVENYYKDCNLIIISCQNVLEKDNLTSVEKISILNYMRDIVLMENNFDAKNKNFILAMSTIGLVAVGIIAGTLTTSLGGNINVNFGNLKKQ